MVTCPQLPRARWSIHTRIYSKYRPAHLPFIAGSALPTGSDHEFHLPIWFFILDLGSAEKNRRKKPHYTGQLLLFSCGLQGVHSSARLAGGASVRFDLFSALAVGPKHRLALSGSSFSLIIIPLQDTLPSPPNTIYSGRFLTRWNPRVN